MSPFRIALANIKFPATPEESVVLAEQAIAQASIERADLICFPECFIPGHRGMGKLVPPPDPAFLERAWSVVAGDAAQLPTLRQAGVAHRGHRHHRGHRTPRGALQIGLDDL